MEILCKHSLKWEFLSNRRYKSVFYELLNLFYLLFRYLGAIRMRNLLYVIKYKSTTLMYLLPLPYLFYISFCSTVLLPVRLITVHRNDSEFNRIELLFAIKCFCLLHVILNIIELYTVKLNTIIKHLIQ